MEFVQPIKDKKKLDAMKKLLKSNMRDYCLFVLGINSGLRITDLLELKVSDVLDGKGKPVDRIRLREEKTNKVKDFPLGDTTKKAIVEYMTQRGACDMNEWLFPSRKTTGKHGRITRQQAYRIINDAARDVGIHENIGTHTLRKTFGYHAYQMGMDIVRIQKLLNHSAPSVTLRYIGIEQEELDEVYLNLNL